MCYPYLKKAPEASPVGCAYSLEQRPNKHHFLPEGNVLKAYLNYFTLSTFHSQAEKGKTT